MANMWCAHTRRPEERDGHGGGRDRLVAEDRLAREHRQDLRDHAECGQDHDVDLGVPEEPEQVLPEHRVAAAGGIEEGGAEVAVREQHRHRGGHGRQRDDQQVAVHQDRPHEERHAAPAHALGAHVVDRRDEVDGAHQRRDAGEVDQEDPGVHAPAGRVHVVGQRRVHGPAGPGRVEEDARVEGHPAEEQEPERERVQAREGHVPGADHQRDQVVAEAGQHRHHEQEDHRGAVHRDQPVVGLGRDHGAVRLRQLEAHHQGLDAADDEEDEGGEQVEDPDLLVVGGGQPLEPAARTLAPGVQHDLRAAAHVPPAESLRLHYSSSPSFSRSLRWAPSVLAGLLDVLTRLHRPARELRRGSRRAPWRACRRG